MTWDAYAANAANDEIAFLKGELSVKDKRIAELEEFNRALAERCAGQSELLTKRASAPDPDAITFSCRVDSAQGDDECAAGRAAAMAYCDRADNVPELRENAAQIRRLIEGMKRSEQMRNHL